MPYPENIRKRKLQEIIAEDETSLLEYLSYLKVKKEVLIHIEFL